MAEMRADGGGYLLRRSFVRLWAKAVITDLRSKMPQHVILDSYQSNR